jgi:hypothetical protein
VKLGLIIGCALVIISLTYLGAGAWIRDRQRAAQYRRPRGGDKDRG